MAVGLEMTHTEGARGLAGGVPASVLREIVRVLQGQVGARRAPVPRLRTHPPRRIYDAAKDALLRDGLALKIASTTIADTIDSYLADLADLVKGAPRAFRTKCTANAHMQSVCRRTCCKNWSPYRSVPHAFAFI